MIARPQDDQALAAAVDAGRLVARVADEGRGFQVDPNVTTIPGFAACVQMRMFGVPSTVQMQFGQRPDMHSSPRGR